MHSIELSNLKLLAVIAKVDAGEELKSNVEAMTACSLLHDPADDDKVY